MKLEKHRYDDIVILKFTGEFDTFNLPGFSERIDKMIADGDTLLILDMHLLKFINSAALGYLIKTSKAIKDKNGEMVMARPSKFTKRTLATLGLDGVFNVFKTVEDAIQHFKKDEEIGQLNLETGEYDESLTGAVPILFRPASGGDGASAPPNQVGRIVTLHENGLLFRYELGDKASDPVHEYMRAGADLKLKFRQPFAVKDYYFEMSASVVQVDELGAGEDDAVIAVKVEYADIKADDKEHLEQFVRDQDAWKAELK